MGLFCRVVRTWAWTVNKFIVFNPDKKKWESEESQSPMLIFASVKGFFWTQGGEENLWNYLEEYLIGLHRYVMLKGLRI